MSELLAAAAAALGLPEALAQRSAEARAAETGASVDDILTEWAGGAPAPTTSVAASPEDAPTESSPVAVAEPVPPIPEIPVPMVSTLPDSAVPTIPYEPPVLVGVKDNPMTVLLSAIGLFAIIVLIGLVGPASQADEPGARTSDLPYTQAAVEGREIYGSLGCASCHTQMVRPVVADVGLGGVTLNDSSQIHGTRRFGPDLSDVGSRVSGGQVEAIIGGFDGHPTHSLTSDDMSRLVAYLTQSQTSGGG